MVRDDLYVKIPTYFRCPISLEVMKSPVSLCTGVTYDRTSIQRWLDAGNNTCPATMQVLQSKDLVPNHTLHRLIKIWLASTHPTPPTQQANELVNQLETELRKPFKHSNLINQYLTKLISFAAESEENGKFVASIGKRILPLLISLLEKVRELSFLERIILFCNVLLRNRVFEESKINLGNNNRESVMMCLKQGKLELRIAAVKFLDLTAAANSTLDLNSETDEIYNELLRLISSSNYNPEALDASLCFLLRLASPKKNRIKLVKSGGVKILSTALSKPELNPPLIEKLLKLIEMMSGCKEGRNEICGDEICLQSIVQKVLKVSNVATEHAVTVLWSLCCLFGDKRATAAMAESNGMAKILVLLQSNCSPAVRQMCGDLLRAFKCKAKISCLSCYDTKTTHIMPF